MSKLTPFGAALRKLRIDHEMRLFDLAEKLGKSASLISAIETGRKQIPDRFVADLVKGMNLSAEEHKALRSAKERTQKEVSVNHLPPDGRELVAALARNSEELPAALLEQIRKHVLKSVDDEIPFRRKRRGMLVAPMSKALIEDFATRVRTIFKCISTPKFPIIEAIEFGLPSLVQGFVFDVRDRDEMGGDEGRVLPGQNTLILRLDVYEKACKGDGRARFTAGHELGHFVMHHETSFARASCDSDPIYCDAEWQADEFAGYLLIPRSLVHQYPNAAAAAEAFGTSVAAAGVIISKYSR